MRAQVSSQHEDKDPVASPARNAERSSRWGWREEGADLMRGFAGGALVGLPLLYTMEMWWHGLTLSEWHLLAVLGATLVVNFLFCLGSGLREDYTALGALDDAVTSVGIGIVFSGVVLALIGELTLDVAPREMLGKVLLEAAPVSVGASFANAHLRGKSRRGDEESGQQPEEPTGDGERMQLRADLRDAAATLAGSTILALSIAPTEEVIMIASRLMPLQQLALLGGIVLICHIILYASGFEDQPVYVDSVFQRPWAETVMTCAMSLGVSFLLLVLLGERETMSHLSTAVAAVITLGLPAVAGGAAGRLVT